MDTFYFELDGGVVKFPSPCGEKVGINVKAISEGEVVYVKFPSPCGEKVGINHVDLSDPELGQKLFPSPCGEKVGINWRVPDLVVDKVPEWGFRPLAGKR